MFTINSKAFVASMMAARVTLARRVIQALRRTAEKAAQFASKSGLYRHRTGQLSKSIRPKLVNDTHAQAAATAKHAAWVENGNTFRTGAAFIYPKHSKFLKFSIDGSTIFARRVKASKPRPFMAEAARKTEPLFDRMCRSAVDRMFD